MYPDSETALAQFRNRCTAQLLLAPSPTPGSYAATDSGAYYDAAAHQLRGRFRWRHQPAGMRLSGTVLAGRPAAARAQLALAAPYPNPFRTTTTACEVPAAGHYTVVLCQVQGRRVRDLPLGASRTGNKKWHF